MSLLDVSHISYRNEENFVLKEISFTQQSLRNIGLAGATGSGKTTLLKIIAGLIEPTIGAVFFKEERIKGPNEKLLPGHPSIAYLSQYFELRNHYRVQEILDMAKKVADKEAGIIYEVCRIQHLLKRWTHQLSGGEKQRIALARLLVTLPEVLLLDEPYSNLDPLHKNILKNVVQDLSEELNITCILVSHDPLDTLSWANEIIVLNEGKLVQQGSPKQVYRNPVDEYTAGLFGKYNLLTPALAKALSQHSDVAMQDIGRFLRPEEFALTTEGKGLKATVKNVKFMGSYCELVLNTLNNELVLHTREANITKGGNVYVVL